MSQPDNFPACYTLLFDCVPMWDSRHPGARLYRYDLRLKHAARVADKLGCTVGYLVQLATRFAERTREWPFETEFRPMRLVEVPVMQSTDSIVDSIAGKYDKLVMGGVSVEWPEPNERTH